LAASSQITHRKKSRSWFSGTKLLKVSCDKYDNVTAKCCASVS